jgi:hypothetical protein
MKIGNRVIKGYTDFETISEPWNLYSLKDGSVLKFRLILIKLIPVSEDGVKGYAVNAGNAAGVLVPKKLKGSPSKSHGSDLKVAEKDIPYKVISEDWNSYKLEDGTILKIKPAISSVNRSKTIDAYGDPVYLINHQVLIKA